jgi:caffeoyl-CoA O-methyltransferase
MRDYAIKNGVPIVSRQVMQFLVTLLTRHKPKTMLEIGTAIGYSALVCHTACKNIGQELKITTIEKNSEMIYFAEQNFQKNNASNDIKPMLGDASDVITELNNTEQKFDFIFLDGAKGQYLSMLPILDNMLNTGGVLVCDNVLFSGMVAGDKETREVEFNPAILKRKRTIIARMKKFLSAICADPHFVTSIIPLGDGVSISIKTK